MKRLLFAVGLSFFGLSSAALSQTSAEISDMPYSGAPCTADGGIKPSKSQVAIFNRFDTELRSALRRNDVAALAFLVDFPLRVNTSKGTVLLPDAQSLGGHYAEFFSEDLRQKVLATVADDYICRYDEGLGYKDGVIWVSTDGKAFTLQSVNTTDPPVKSSKPELVYTCNTTTHRISIEDLNNGKYRYRSWNKPKALSESPDIEIPDGNLHFEGSGVCAYGVFSFTKGDAEYTVSQGMGCTDGKEPKRATGDLLVTVAGKVVTQAWCF